MKKSFVNPNTVARPVGNYSHAVVTEVGDAAIIVIAGQVAIDNDGNLVGENDMAAQAEFVFKQLAGILAACGASMSDLIKTNYYVTDMSRLGEVAAVRGHYISGDFPASTAVEVSKLARPGLLLEVEAMATVQR